jgi:hypothetical protein
LREKLVGQRMATYAKAQAQFQQFMTTLNGLAALDAELRRLAAVRVGDLRTEINKVWSGACEHTAFARLGLESVAKFYAEMGVPVSLPLRPI